MFLNNPGMAYVCSVSCSFVLGGSECDEYLALLIAEETHVWMKCDMAENENENEYDNGDEIDNVSTLFIADEISK